MLVWVYWTLKKGHWNCHVMTRAKWVFVRKDHIEVSELDCVWFPRVKLWEWTWKFLEVEVYEVPLDGVLWPLDRLEWYSKDSSYNHYNRVVTTSLKGDEISVYEINSSIPINQIENFFVEEDKRGKFYNWL